jgi:hypothetical protein
MKSTATSLRLAAAGALALSIVAGANAQSSTSLKPIELNFQASQRNTWNTVMLISAAVGIVGVVQGDSTLTLLGGAGVVLSLYQMERNRYGFRGFEFAKSGPVSMGINPLGVGFSQSISSVRPTAYIQATFKF